MNSALLATIALILIFSPSFINTKLAVRWPNDLNQKFDKVNGIEYYVITPEHSNEKRSYIGNLVLAGSGCDDFKSIPDEISNPIAVVTAGECSFAQKAKNAELAGARMVLIITNEDLQATRQKQRDLRFPVHIETIVVGKADGDILINHLRSQDPGNTYSLPEISYTMDVDKYVNAQLRSDPVRIDYWYAASNLDASSFAPLEDLQTLVLNMMPDNVVFTPHYVLWRNDAASEREPNGWCVSGSRYCDPEPGDSNLGGGESVLEDLRQLCLFQVSDNLDKPEFWWDYVMKFSRECMAKKGISLTSCREYAFQTAGISQNVISQVDQCMRDSFVGGVDSYTDLLHVTEDNKLLRTEYEEQDQFGLTTYPSIYVNDARYEGSLRDFDSIRDFVCDHFPTEHDPPRGCPKRNSEKDIQIKKVEPESGFLFYLGVGVFSTLFMIVLIYCVRRNIKREVMGKMNQEIETIVSQYTQIKIDSES